MNTTPRKVCFSDKKANFDLAKSLNDDNIHNKLILIDEVIVPESDKSSYNKERKLTKSLQLADIDPSLSIMKTSNNPQIRSDEAYVSSSLRFRLVYGFKAYICCLR